MAIEERLKRKYVYQLGMISEAKTVAGSLESTLLNTTFFIFLSKGPSAHGQAILLKHFSYTPYIKVQLQFSPPLCVQLGLPRPFALYMCFLRQILSFLWSWI